MSDGTLEARLPEALRDRFRLLGLLGQGVGGVVLRVEVLATVRQAAPKIFTARQDVATALARFRQEADVAAALDHPHLLPLLDSQVDPEGISFLLYPVVEGGDLQSRLDSQEPISLEQALTWTRQVGSALAAMHAADLTHRDLKPANILLDAEGDAVVADFGMVRLRRSRIQTTTGLVLGTPHYVPPEVWRGARPGPEADQFALAVVLHQLLVGTCVYPVESLPELTEWVRRDEELALPQDLEVPDPVREALRRGLRRRPEDRFPSVADFVAALEAPSPASTAAAARTALPSQAPGTPAPARDARRSGPRRDLSRPLGALAGMAVLATLALAALLPGEGEAPAPGSSPEAPAIDPADWSPLADARARLLRFHPGEVEVHRDLDALLEATGPMLTSPRVELAFGRLLEKLVEATSRGPRPSPVGLSRSVEDGLGHVIRDFQHAVRRTPSLLADHAAALPQEALLGITRTYQGLMNRVDAAREELATGPRPEAPEVLVLRAHLARWAGERLQRNAPVSRSADALLAALGRALERPEEPAWAPALDHARRVLLDGQYLPGFLACGPRAEAFAADLLARWPPEERRALPRHRLLVLVGRVGTRVLAQVSQCPDQAARLLPLGEAILDEAARREPRLTLAAERRETWERDYAAIRESSPSFRRTWERLLATVDWTP